MRLFWIDFYTYYGQISNGNPMRIKLIKETVENGIFHEKEFRPRKLRKSSFERMQKL